MIVSPQLKYVFVSTPKCGTNTLYTVLTEHYQGKRRGPFHSRNVSGLPKNWLYFTTCRNPYTRAVSIWWSTTQRGKDRYGFRTECPSPDSFETFCEWARDQKKKHSLLLSQSEWQKEITFDVVLRLETLVEDFSNLPFVEAAISEFPSLNSTVNFRQGAEYYYTERAKEAVQEWMGPDFKRFKYGLALPKKEGLNG